MGKTVGYCCTPMMYSLSVNNSLRLDRLGYLFFFLVFLALFPQMPPVFGRSEFHINIVAVFLAVLSTVKFGPLVSQSSFCLVATYFFVLQALLFLSYLLGSEGVASFNELPSLFRPTMLFVIAVGFLVLLRDFHGGIRTAISVAGFLTVISFFYAIFEVFLFQYSSPYIHAVYRLEDKSNIDGVSVSFFTLPYYAAYCHGILLLFHMAAISYGFSFFRLILLLMCLSNIALTQSKTGIFISFASLFLFWFLSVRGSVKLIVLVLAICTASAIGFYLYDLVGFLNKSVGGNFAYTTLLILERPDEAGNLVERLSQIVNTYESIVGHNFYVGVGLGKGETIESWLAYVPYRYGFFGFMFFVFFYLCLFFRCSYVASKSPSIDISIGARIVAVWVATLFFSQLSSLSMEMSKSGVFSSFLIALSSRISLVKAQT